MNERHYEDASEFIGYFFTSVEPVLNIDSGEQLVALRIRTRDGAVTKYLYGVDQAIEVAYMIENAAKRQMSGELGPAT